MKAVAHTGAMTLVAHRGDGKTLLGFDLPNAAARSRLAGFTIAVILPGGARYYLLNDLRYANASAHAQDPKESPFATINAPIHKFRWVHVPGSVHQGLDPAYGTYSYAVTPRYFNDSQSMLPLDASLTATVTVEVAPFVKGALSVGVTRGFTQSQAFVRHFGLDALIRPKGDALIFDTTAICGTNAQGQSYTYAQQYEWSGFTARKLIFDVLDRVLADATLSVDIFAYDLNEPDIINRLLRLGTSRQARIILDDAALHHSTIRPKPEDQFAELFAARAGADRIKRGHFGRYSHQKTMIVSRSGTPQTVLTGSTNLSVTGLYVNSNHVLVFEDADLAAIYAGMYEEAWNDDVQAAAFEKSRYATQSFHVGSATVPDTAVTFAPHPKAFAAETLDGLVQRIDAEEKVASGLGCVVFAVMELKGGANNPVYEALNALHASTSVFSFGISDDPDGIALYPIGSETGVLVTGKPGTTQLPPPFDQVRTIGGFGHQVHDKFVVCGFNGADPVVYCGSSNLALGGEQVNGDNLLAIRDADVAGVFTIEALLLVDHFNFLDSLQKNATTTPGKARKAAVADHIAHPALRRESAEAAGWFLGTTDAWAAKFFDPDDLHFKDREIFSR